MATLAAPGVSATARSRTDVTDHDLVEAVRAGDDHAFERLYERYHRRITAYVLGMVRDHGRAEDLTQEIFVSALRRMRQTDRPIHFKPWIYEIAKNACIDAFRRSRRAEEVSIDAGDEAGGADAARLATTAAAPDAAVVAKQRLDHLWGAFDGLSDAHHQILVMRELEGLSYAEIGERLGLSRASVESQLFRARRRLTEEYEELQTGEACRRAQGIIDGAGAAALGRRDQRRLGRHIARCTPCRREAVLAGLDAAAMARLPVRAKLGLFLPLPVVLRRRWFGGPDAPAGADAHAASWSNALAAYGDAPATWVKGVAAALAVAVAGVGAGTAVTGGKAGDHPAGTHRSAPAAAATPAAARRAQHPVATRGAASSARSHRTAARRAAGPGASRAAGAGAAERPAPATARRGGSGSGQQAAGTTAPASTSSPLGGAERLVNATTGRAPLADPDPTALTTAPASPPASAGGAVQHAGGAAGGAVGGSVGQAVQDAGAAAGSAVDQVTTTATDTVNRTVDAIDSTVKGVAGTVTRTVEDSARATGTTAGAAGQSVKGVVGGVSGGR